MAPVPEPPGSVARAGSDEIRSVSSQSEEAIARAFRSVTERTDPRLLSDGGSFVPPVDVPDQRRRKPPAEILTPEALAIITAHLTDYICVHVPVFDDAGEVVDGSLVWWNDAYERARVQTVRFGQSLMDTYYEPEEALGYFRTAYHTGHVHQLFEISAEAHSRYRVLDDIVRIDMEWLRMGPYVMEVGSDHSRVTALEVQLHEQELAIREALQQRLRDHDRERIARDLHDSVIQQLFVTILDLKSAEHRDAETKTDAIRHAVKAIDQTVSDLRSMIFALQHDVPLTLEEQLREVIGSFRAAPFSVELRVTHGVDLPPDLAEDVRLVVLEALANVARHADARHVEVTVGLDGSTLDVSIVDDGVGPPGQRTRESGLANLTARARERGGWCWLEPAATGCGSHLRWAVPLPT